MTNLVVVSPRELVARLALELDLQARDEGGEGGQDGPEEEDETDLGHDETDLGHGQPQLTTENQPVNNLALN